MSSISPRPSRRFTSALTTARMSSLRSVRCGVGRVEVEAHVHLHAADRRKVIALGVEEQRLEHRLGAFDRRRLARTHDAIDVEQRVLARGVLVDLQRVADIGADVDVVDVEHRQLLEARLEQLRERLLGDLVAGLGVDFAGLRVIEVLGDILAVEVGVARAQRLQALLGELARRAHGQLRPASIATSPVSASIEVGGGLDALHALGVERHAPAVLERGCRRSCDRRSTGSPRRRGRARRAARSPESCGAGRCAHGRCPWRRTRCRATSRDRE